MCSNTNWTEVFVKINALWLRNGNPSHPHALLTSGLHSSGFFNATKVVENPNVLQRACHELSAQIIHLLESSPEVKHPQIVVGSALGAITIAHECARSMLIRMAYTEKTETGRALLRFYVKKGEKILVVEDVITTGDTTRKTIDTLEEAGAEVLPIVGTLVNRSGKESLDDRKIVSLIEHPMPTWEKQDCPLCKDGSTAIHPKNNWRELTHSL